MYIKHKLGIITVDSLFNLCTGWERERERERERDKICKLHENAIAFHNVARYFVIYFAFLLPIGGKINGNQRKNI